MEQFDPSTSFQNLKAFLLLRRVTLADIARKHGFVPLMFQQMARAYWGTDRQPRAIQMDKMLRALREEIAVMRGAADEPRAAAGE